MITLTAAQQTALRARNARVGVRLKWLYDPTDTVGSGNSYTMNMSGLDETGRWRPDFHRLEELTLENRVPYLGEGIYFPSLNASIDLFGQGSSDPYWFYDYTVGPPIVPLANKALLGGRLTVYGEICQSDSCITLVEMQRLVTDDIRQSGTPPRMEITGASSRRMLAEMTIDQTETFANPARIPNVSPVDIITQISDHIFGAGIGREATSFPAAKADLTVANIWVRMRLLPESKWILADAFTQAVWHGAGSLYIDESDLMHWHHWPLSYSGTPDATWSESDIVRGSVSVLPRYDRIVTTHDLFGRNTYLNAQYHIQFGDGCVTWFGTKNKAWRLDFYDITPTGGGTCDMTSVVTRLSAPFTPMDPSDASKARLPVQLRCSVPFSVGLPMQMGDYVHIDYDPLAIGASGGVWRIEERRFRASRMTFDFALHDRIMV